MPGRLKAAVKSQRRLIFIFFLTVLLPSLALSILGIRSIRNERFRQEKQLENQHQRAAEILLERVSSEFRDLGARLEKSVRSPAFAERDEAGFARTLKTELSDVPLVETVFLLYENEDARFPLFQASLRKANAARPSLTSALQEKLNSAQAVEFVKKDNRAAAILYRELAEQMGDPKLRARFLSAEARCLAKVKEFRAAITIYNRIDLDFPDALSENGVPLALLGRLQAARGYLESGEIESALSISSRLLRDILEMRWSLEEAPFKAYASLAEEVVAAAIARCPDASLGQKYENELAGWKKRSLERADQWAVVNEVRAEIIPELRQRQASLENRSAPLHFAKTVKGRSLLVLSAAIPDRSGAGFLGILGVLLKNGVLLSETIGRAVQDIQLAGGTKVVVSDAEGNRLLGENPAEGEPSTVTQFFPDNFPPWRIEFFRTAGAGFGRTDVTRSFYFWTICTMLLILAFGTGLVIRAVSQEMDLLKLKADFVASVSHELKTPLTSIKALTERLQDDKVRDPSKLKQYYSLISESTDRLIRLVRNILDFSKIEEKRKEYEMVPADPARLVAQAAGDFEREMSASGVKVVTKIETGLPLLRLDAGAVSQAIHNLFENAVKFSPDRKVIEVAARREGDCVVIEVRDQGVGIPVEEQDKIFNKFFQGKYALGQAARGTGLGLTLVKHTVEAHGGRVWLKSRDGEGSTFTLAFPISGG